MIYHVSTNLGKVAVHISGQDPAQSPGLMLLHANPGDHRDFEQVIPYLAPKWAVAAVDWPGYGYSPVIDGTSVTARGLAEVAIQVHDALVSKYFRPVSLIGNSIGGYAAIRLAQHRPEHVTGLVLVQSAGFVPVNPLTRLLFRAMGSRSVARRVVTPAARAYLGNLDHGGIRAVYERAARIPADPVRLDVYRSIWSSLSDPSLDLDSQGSILPDIPVQVVWGKRDPINPWKINQRAIGRTLPHAEVVVLPTRHEPFCEQPRMFLDAVLPFLEKHAGIEL